MEFPDHQLLSLLIRWIHVASMAGALGGAMLLWGLSLKADEYQRMLPLIASRYEVLFWIAMGLLVMTGVGNLGAFGAALPGRDTGWGKIFSIKIIAVLILILLSVIRTLFITRLSASGDTMRAAQALRLTYATTTLVLVFILLLAVSLAHS